MAVTTFEQLEVWKRAHQLVLRVYRMTSGFPSDERFGLTSQLRRAMVSVPANIAEGFVKRSKADKARFYNMAQGSLEECRYYFILARDLRFTDVEQELNDLSEVSRMLESYTAKVLASRFNVPTILFLAAVAFSASGFLLLASGFFQGTRHG